MRLQNWIGLSLTVFAAVAGLSLDARPAQADTIVYTNRAQFLAAVNGTTTIDFDNPANNAVHVQYTSSGANFGGAFFAGETNWGNNNPLSVPTLYSVDGSFNGGLASLDGSDSMTGGYSYTGASINFVNMWAPGSIASVAIGVDVGVYGSSGSINYDLHTIAGLVSSGTIDQHSGPTPGTSDFTGITPAFIGVVMTGAGDQLPYISLRLTSTLGDLGGGGKYLAFDNFVYATGVNPVPEPSTLALMAIAAGGAATRARRTSRRA